MHVVEKYRQLILDAEGYLRVHPDACDGKTHHIRYHGSTATVTLKGE